MVAGRPHFAGQMISEKKYPHETPNLYFCLSKKNLTVRWPLSTPLLNE